MVKIIGRIKEIEKLNNVCERNGAQLVVVYGRRRVGKTYLINTYFDNEFVFKLTGVDSNNKKGNLRNFLSELVRRGINVERDIDEWSEAFDLLRAYLSSQDNGKKQVVFFDEMPWLDNQKSGFKEAFEYFWNDYAVTNDNLIFIACGSASAWIKKYLINNKGGLFNRFTEKIYLEPFCLNETEEFLKSRNIHLSRYELIEAYMVLGGIPFYLSFLDKNKTLSENIDTLFFEKNATLVNEFDNLYKTLFSNHELYKRVVETIFSKPSGMNRDEICTKAKTPGNGYLTDLLDDLESSGFIRKRIKNGDRKETIYVLTDYYTRFYFKFVKDNWGRDERYWQNSYSDPAKLSWLGNTFELVCFDHISQIKEALGISGVLTDEYAFRKQGDNTIGAQIDLVLSRKDNVISVCEIKYSKNEFVIDKDYYQKLINKIEVFRNNTKVNKTIQLVLVSTFGIRKNEYSGIVNKSITIDDLFK